MTLVKWNPEREMNLLQRQVNRLFDDFFGSPWTGSDRPLASWEPVVDIRENADAYSVHVELPGVKKEEVRITLQNNTLTIRGEKKQESEQKDANFHRIERSYGAFERSFTLPATVRNDKVDASFADGVLTILLPKTEEAKPKEIAVKIR